MESLLNVAELHITWCLWFATLTQIAFEKKKYLINIMKF